MKTARQLFTIFMIALLLASVVSAAPFTILSSTNLVKSQPVEEKMVAEPADSSDVQVKTVSTSPFVIMKDREEMLPEPQEEVDEAVPVDRLYDDVSMIYPKDDSPDEPKDPAGDQEQTPEEPEGEPIYWNSGYGINRDALTVVDRVWFDWIGPESTLLHFEEKSVSGDTEAGQTFTITVTAADADDDVTRVSLGVSPYTNDDYDIRDCDPGAHSCTHEFELSESEAGVYTYRIKAKNERNQIISDAVVVTVVEHTTTSTFRLHTSALDGADWDAGVTDYIDSTIFVWGDDVTGLELSGTPFATFSVPADHLLGVRYTATDYSDDIDHLYLDSDLPSCSGDSCVLSADVDGTTWATSCDLIAWDDHYACELSNGDGYRITFDYRATGDPIGDNTIRRYNLLYPESAPIVNFGSDVFEFNEDEELVIDLDDYVYDADTDDPDINWLVLRDHNLDVFIDPATHEATISQVNPAWIGSELLEFVALDPEGNRGSDIVTVSVLDMSNNPPVITDTNPDTGSVNVGMAGSRLFSINAIDPDYDYLTVAWYKDGAEVASDTFSYMYADVDGLSHPLRVTVSDGTESVDASWTVNIVEPIGDLAGTVTDSDSGLPLEGVLVELLDAGMSPMDSMSTPVSGGYLFEGLFAGTYNLRLTLDGYEEEIVNDVQIFAGEITIHDVEINEIPLPIGTLMGVVTDSADSSAMSGVLVEAFAPGMVLEDSTTTDAFGQYSMELNEGLYTVRFTKTGYDSEEFPSVAIVTGGTTMQDAVMTESSEATGTVQGTVTDADTGLPVSGALVEVLDGIMLVNSSTTSGSGTYSMDVLAGTYTIRSTQSGYAIESYAGVVVTPGMITAVNFDMIPWWNDAWSYRKQLQITASPDLEDTFVFWQLDADVITNSEPDLSDLRVIAGESDEVDFQIFEADTGQPFNSVFGSGTWIGFNVNVTASVSDYALYYGNPSVLSAGDVTWFHGGMGFSNTSDMTQHCNYASSNVGIDAINVLWGSGSIAETAPGAECKVLDRWDWSTGAYDDLTFVYVGKTLDATSSESSYWLLGNLLGSAGWGNAVPSFFATFTKGDSDYMQTIGTQSGSCSNGAGGSWYEADTDVLEEEGWHTVRYAYDSTGGSPASIDFYIDDDNAPKYSNSMLSACNIDDMVIMPEMGATVFNFALWSFDTKGTVLDVTDVYFGDGTVDTSLGPQQSI